jgi:hypothetical protein
MERILILLALVLVVAGCAAPQSITVDNDPVESGKTSSPLNLVLQADALADGEVEITATMSMPPADRSNLAAEGVTLDIILPEQLQVVEGSPHLSGFDIRPGETINDVIRVRIVKDGEGVIQATSITAHNETQPYYYGDNEDIFFLVKDGKIRFSELPFNPPAATRVESVPVN